MKGKHIPKAQCLLRSWLKCAESVSQPTPCRQLMIFQRFAAALLISSQAIQRCAVWLKWPAFGIPFFLSANFAQVLHRKMDF